MTYSLGSDKWELISEPVKGDGTNFPARIQDPALIYDPERDGLLFTGDGGTAFFEMTTQKWRNAGPRSSYSSAVSYGGGGIFRLSSGASGNHFFFHRFDYGRKAWDELGYAGPSLQKIDRGCKLPPGRTYPGEIMVYDPPRKRFLMFSGDQALNDTWTYDLARNEWAEIKPAASPPPHYRQSTCYDSGNDLVVIHGGRKPEDTWVFDAGRNSWFEVTPAEKPGFAQEATPGKPPEGTGHIEYDSANKCCIAWNSGCGEVWTLRIERAGK